MIITVLLHLHHLLARPWSGSFSPSLLNVSVLMTCSLALRRVCPLHCALHGFVKCVVTQYLSNESPVYGCFLDLSKAFDLVDHNLLFRRLLDRSLPLAIVHLLMTWYHEQNMRVWWSQTLSDSFLSPMVCVKRAFSLQFCSQSI